MIDEGAEAKVYATSILGIRAVVKCRERKAYRVSAMDARLRARRTRSEARILGIAASVGVASPRPLLVRAHEIVISRVEGVPLWRALSSGALDGRAESKIMRAAGRSLGKLHCAGVAHGDFTPANIMVAAGREPVVIDFGLAEVTESVEAMAIDLLLMKRSIDARHYHDFVSGYRSSFRDAGIVMDKLSMIERRGRYKTRTLLASCEAP